MTNTVAQINGLEKIYFEGNESMPWHKFSIVLTSLQKRIMNERSLYNPNDFRTAIKLLQMARSMEVLFQSQDSPLYSIQSGAMINMLAEDMVMKIQNKVQFTPDKFPPIERQIFLKLYNDHENLKKIRDHKLNEYLTAEKFCRIIDSDLQYSVSCMLGMTQRVRHLLEQLSKFNSIITERFYIMNTNYDKENGYMVNYVLSHTAKLERLYGTLFPHAYRIRDRRYDGELLETI